MIFDILTETLNLFLKRRKEQVGHDSDMIHIRKRQLLHQGIPDVDTIMGLCGDRFIRLQQLFDAFDPVPGEKLTDNPDKYRLLTKTVIYKLPGLHSREAVSDMLYLEFSLWFKHAYHPYKCKEELTDAVYLFKTACFSSNPFQNKPPHP